MTAPDDRDLARNGPKGISDRQRQREARLATQLRSNLKRRKAQARARDDDIDVPCAAVGDAPDRDGGSD